MLRWSVTRLGIGVAALLAVATLSDTAAVSKASADDSVRIFNAVYRPEISQTEATPVAWHGGYGGHYGGYRNYGYSNYGGYRNYGYSNYGYRNYGYSNYG